MTGGSRGIGLATVESLVASGARVAFTGRNETVGEDAAGELHAGGGDVLFVPADAGSEDDCRKMVESALTPMGIAHPEMHVLALRLVSILNCLIEIGLGSIVVGALSDYFERTFADGPITTRFLPATE